MALVPWLLALLLAVPAARADGAGSRAEDLDLAERLYVRASPAFSSAARERAIAFIARQRPRADAMTPAQFLVCLLAIPAFADNGHDVLNDESGAWYPSARLPLRMLWFPDGWVVARAAPGHADLLGARVLSIEGLGAAAMLDRLRPVWGGPDTSRRWNLEWIIENAGLLHALGLAASPDRLRLDVELAGGRRVRRRIAFVPASQVPAGVGAVQLWSPDPWPGEPERGWRSLPAGPVPLYLADGAKRFRVAPLPDRDALYVQFRSHLDGPGEPVADFLQAVDGALAAQQPRDLVLDLRFDTGGNADLTRDWLRTLPDRVPGRLYVLIGRYTFSAGIIAAAAAKHDGGAKVRLVGEPPGDWLVWWSEGRDVCLPHSHYCLHLTTGLWNLERGCAAEPGCYGDKYDVVVGDLTPQVSAPLTAAAWLGGRDPALEAIDPELRRP